MTATFGRTIRSALLVAALALAGCGGAAVHGVPAVAGPNAVGLAVTLPRATASSSQRRIAFIAPSVRSGKFAVNGGTPVVAALVAGAPGCATTAAGLTCTITLEAPAGSDTFSVALYDAASAGGSLLGSGSATATIAPNVSNTVGITIGGVVASVLLSLATTTPVQGAMVQIPLTVEALDADGNIIVTDPFAVPLTLTDSDTSGNTQLSTTQLTSPGTPVNVLYTGAALPNATFSATVTGSTPAVRTAVLTPKTESTVDWSTFGFNAQRTSYDPDESVCCTTAPRAMWTRVLASKYLTAEPVFANNVWVASIPGGGAYVDLLFVADNHADLYALNAQNGAVVWMKTLGTQSTTCTDMPDKIFGITGTPLLDRASGRLYVADGAGKLWALDPASGNVASGWPANGLNVVTKPRLDHVYGGLNLDTVHGIMPVPTASYCDDGDWTGSVAFVNVNTASVVNTFIFAPKPNWGSGMWGMGGTSLDPSTGDIVGASGNAEPNEDLLYSDSVLRWTTGTFAVAGTSQSSNNVGDDDFGAIPSLFPSPDGKLCAGVEGKSGILYMFDSANIGAGHVSAQQLGFANSDDFNSATPSYSPVTQKIYITTGYAGTPGFPPGTYAFTVEDGCKIASTPDWSWASGGTNFLTPTTVANGVVFVGVGNDVYGLDATTGTQLWKAYVGSQDVYAGVTVIDGMVFTADWDGTVSAFAAPGAQGMGRAHRGAS